MFYRPHSRVTAEIGGPSLTKQSHKEECDIHNILRQYQKTGIITHVQSARPTYEDLPDNIDYQDSLNTLMAANETFSALPAKVRDHFDNDPAKFLAAFYDSKQEDQLREFGLLKAKPPEPAPPPVIPELPQP